MDWSRKGPGKDSQFLCSEYGRKSGTSRFIKENLLNISRSWQKMLSFSYCSVRDVHMHCITYNMYTLCTIIHKVESFHNYFNFSLKIKSLSFQNQEKFELCNFIALILRVMPMDEVNIKSFCCEKLCEYF